MTTYYRLDVLWENEWVCNGMEFSTVDAASEFRENLIEDSVHSCKWKSWAYVSIVEDGCPTRIMEVQVTERVIQEFPGLPVEDGA